MSHSHRSATQRYRARLALNGLARFEVLGLDADRELIRAVARRLAEDGPGASPLRASVRQTIAADPPPAKGDIVAALRRSPLVGAGLDLTRPHVDGRKIEL